MDLKRFIISNKKILSVFFTVAFSAFVVCTLVYGATTIGTNVTTGGNIFATGTIQADGLVTFYGNVLVGDSSGDMFMASSSVMFTEAATTSNIYPWTNNTYSLGDENYSWKNVYVSGTAYIDTFASPTSTFTGDMLIGQSLATTTLHIGGAEAAGSAPGMGGV
jgi:hypothetical protein